MQGVPLAVAFKRVAKELSVPEASVWFRYEGEKVTGAATIEALDAANDLFTDEELATGKAVIAIEVVVKA